MRWEESRMPTGQMLGGSLSRYGPWTLHAEEDTAFTKNRNPAHKPLG